jgi:V/A-type H+/Na+-transporting ATPase subunit I
MIVEMKKAIIFVLESHKKEALTQLRKLGVIHINPLAVESEELSRILEKRSYFEKALKIIPLETGKDQPENPPPGEKAEPVSIAEQAFTLYEQLMKTKEDLDRCKQEYEDLLPWGNFQPATVRELREKGVDLHFCILQEQNIEKIPGELDYICLEKTNNEAKLMFLGDPGQLPFPVRELSLPKHSLPEMEKLIKEKEETYRKQQDDLAALAPAREMIQEEIKKLDKNLEFEQVRTGMETDEQISYLTGFIPVHATEKLKKAAAKNGWGLILDTPKAEDRVPTLLKNPKFMRILNPIYDLLGTVPGYHEVDISIWFLIFFSVFFAMIIGDAGYGFIILGGAIAARIKMKKAPWPPFALFILMGICTIIWGTITGTWFGVEAIARQEPFSWFVIPQIATFPVPGSGMDMKSTMLNIWNICFTIAIIHLTLAHIISILRLFPKLKIFGEMGNIVFLWGMYFLIQALVLQQQINTNLIIWPLAVGFTAIFLFSYQEGNFVKGILESLKNILPLFLGCIGNFSDIISYIRLFAVGLATVQVAMAFNSMAETIGFSFLTALPSVIILLIGHSLNIAMAGVSVIVHGIRLKMLEFSIHVGIEWSGIEYKPFSEEMN